MRQKLNTHPVQEEIGGNVNLALAKRGRPGLDILFREDSEIIKILSQNYTAFTFMASKDRMKARRILGAFCISLVSSPLGCNLESEAAFLNLFL